MGAQAFTNRFHLPADSAKSSAQSAPRLSLIMRHFRFSSTLFAASFLCLWAKADEASVAQIVAQTERAFSARCSQIGIRDSFLEYFAADAIRFTPEPRLARPDLEQEPSSTKVRLTWEPKIVRVANTSKLAVSTGPYVLQTATNKSYGYYLSVWKQQTDGGWKVAADIGVPGPVASNLADDFQSYQDASDQGGQVDLLSYEREQFSPVLDLDHIYRSVASPETVFERDMQSLQPDKLSMRFFCISRKLSEQNLPRPVAAHPVISVLLTEPNLTETLPLDIYGSGSSARRGGC